MVTLAGFEPATSPVTPVKQGRSIPLELQRRHDLDNRLRRRRGEGRRHTCYFSILIVRVVVAPHFLQL